MAWKDKILPTGKRWDNPRSIPPGMYNAQIKEFKFVKSKRGKGELFLLVYATLYGDVKKWYSENNAVSVREFFEDMKKLLGRNINIELLLNEENRRVLIGKYVRIFVTYNDENDPDHRYPQVYVRHLLKEFVPAAVSEQREREEVHDVIGDPFGDADAEDDEIAGEYVIN